MKSVKTVTGDSRKNPCLGKAFLGAAAIVLLVAGSGTWAKAGWSSGSSSRTGSSTSSWSTSSSGSWSSGGSGTGGIVQCRTSTANLSLTMADCLKCHPGDSTASPNPNANRHHLLPNIGMLCLNCHQLVEDPPGSGNFVTEVIRDCVVCHTSAVHNTVTHCVQDTCRGCHPGSLPQIHAGGGSRSGSRSSYHGGDYGGSSSTSGVSSCFLCHTSRDTRVQQAIIRGLSGQAISCDSCHGRGR